MSDNSISRAEILLAIERLPRIGLGLVEVNARCLADHMNCNRDTIGAALNDLEAEGILKRRRNQGRSGLLIEILRYRTSKSRAPLWG